jgi:hypothetical protein
MGDKFLFVITNDPHPGSPGKPDNRLREKDADDERSNTGYERHEMFICKPSNPQTTPKNIQGHTSMTNSAMGTMLYSMYWHTVGFFCLLESNSTI